VTIAEESMSRALVYPAAIEARYWRMLRARVLSLSKAIDGAMKKGIAKVGTSIDDRAERGDSAATDADVMINFIDEVVLEWEQTHSIAALSPELTPIAVSVDRQVAGELTRTVGRAMEVAPWKPTQEGIYQGWAQGNANLIKNMDQDFIDGVRDQVVSAVNEGKSTRVLAKEVQARTGVTTARARLIARDQVGKMTGAIQEVRQKSLGVTEYIWRTSQDDRVRDGSDGPADHVDLDGTTQKWSEPPNDGNENVHPGWAINCRCTAEPVVPTIEEAAAMGGSSAPPEIGPESAYSWRREFDPKWAADVDAAHGALGVV